MFQKQKPKIEDVKQGPFFKLSSCNFRFKVENFRSDGTTISDISEITIPSTHSIYSLIKQN